MSRGKLAVVLLALTVLVAVVVHGSPKPPAYAPHNVLAGQTLYQAPHAPVALFIGDSYAAGGGADASLQGFPFTTARAMGWIPELDAEPGTGFINDSHAGKFADLTSQPYAGRIAKDQQSFDTDIVIVTGGRNDFHWSAQQAASAAHDYLLQLRRTFPTVKLVIVAPFWMDSHPIPQILAERDAEKALAPSLRAVFIDPLPWMTDQNSKLYLSSDGVHPNQAGHDYIAQRLVAALRAAKV